MGAMAKMLRVKLVYLDYSHLICFENFQHAATDAIEDIWLAPRQWNLNDALNALAAATILQPNVR